MSSKYIKPLLALTMAGSFVLGGPVASAATAANSSSSADSSSNSVSTSSSSSASKTSSSSSSQKAKATKSADTATKSSSTSGSGADVTLKKSQKGTMGSSIVKTKQFSAFSLRRYITQRSNSAPDISEWQGSMSDSQAKALKKEVPFVILRVQYGSDYYDRTFDHNLALVKKYNIPYGVYSFSQYSSPSDAKTEAKDLYNRAPEASFYVNDYEDQTVSSGSTDTATKNWYTEMRSLAGNRKILLYSGQWFVDLYAPKAVGSYDGFWLAAYQSNEPTSTHVLWQYTDSYYSSSLNQNVDASVYTSKPKSWFFSSSSDNSSSNSNSVGATYKHTSTKFTVKNNPEHNFYTHVAGDTRYSRKISHYGSTYAGKDITVDSQGTRTSTGAIYYRCYYNGKNIGWMYHTGLASQVTYSKPAKKTMTVVNKPTSAFYNHVTGSKYASIKVTHASAAYAGKTVTVDSKGTKYGWKTPYYRCYYNGKLVGWIYAGSLK
ncbi:GH25 family lysozyme [Levilactobacillus bambusae]|uniref:GW domain-containing protein n=1 Tax=Levilactobacillus bambusae TaxID=2024736 RepID=A0A2V1MZ29_9LACO|nr:GH25 family lysozyme [Levilactobacillus bambusae]PWG00271.1 hypothetical protein DCM90_04895 [Levilactobacillus bambusae]